MCGFFSLNVPNGPLEDSRETTGSAVDERVERAYPYDRRSLTPSDPPSGTSVSRKGLAGEQRHDLPTRTTCVPQLRSRTPRMEGSFRRRSCRSASDPPLNPRKSSPGAGEAPAGTGSPSRISGGRGRARLQPPIPRSRQRRGHGQGANHLDAGEPPGLLPKVRRQPPLTWGRMGSRTRGQQGAAYGTGRPPWVGGRVGRLSR